MALTAEEAALLTLEPSMILNNSPNPNSFAQVSTGTGVSVPQETLLTITSTDLDFHGAQLALALYA